MDAINALIDIARTFTPLEDEACVTINSTKTGVYVESVRETIEAWKYFEANETGDSSRLVNVFGTGNLHKPMPELQGYYVLWRPKTLQNFNQIYPLATKKITFESDYNTWFASFVDGEARADAYLGTGTWPRKAMIPRFNHFFPKWTMTVTRNAVKQFKAMLRQEVTAGIDDFWLFSTKSNRICASFDRQPKSDSTRRVVLGTVIGTGNIIPYTFPAKRFADMLDLMDNGSVVQAELLTDYCLRVLVETTYGSYAFVLFGSASLIGKWGLQHLIPETTATDRRGYGEACMYGDWDPEENPPR